MYLCQISQLLLEWKKNDLSKEDPNHDCSLQDLALAVGTYHPAMQCIHHETKSVNRAQENLSLPGCWMFPSFVFWFIYLFFKRYFFYWLDKENTRPNKIKLQSVSLLGIKRTMTSCVNFLHCHFMQHTFSVTEYIQASVAHRVLWTGLKTHISPKHCGLS